MAKQFVVNIAADGSIAVETANIKGADCLNEMQTIQQLVPNAAVVDSRVTGDYYDNKAQVQLNDTQVNLQNNVNE